MSEFAEIKGRECPVCGHKGRCKTHTDHGDDLVLCFRETKDDGLFRRIKLTNNCATFARIGSQADPETRKAARANGNGRAPRETAEATAARFERQFDDARATELADELGVTVDSLRAIGTGHDGKFACFPERDASGRVVGINKRRGPTAKPRYLVRKGDKRGLIVPNNLAELPGTVCVVEGPSDTAAALTMGLTAIGRPNDRGGVEELAKLLKGRAVIVVGERDEKSDGTWPGRDGAQHVARGLAAAWGEPVRWALPPNGAKDAREFLTQHSDNTPDELGTLLVAHVEQHAITEQTDAAPVVADADRPAVIIDTDEHRVVSETIEALKADPQLYQRGGILVRIVRDEQPTDGIVRVDGSPTIQPLPPASLRERMTRFAAFSKIVEKGGLRPAHPAQWLVNAIDARGEWPGIRHLLGISDAPVIRADGTVWQTPGYDAATGVLYEPTAKFPPISDRPTIDDAKVALTMLLEVVSDFPFEGEEHKAALLAALLTPLARFAFSGPTPLFLFDANAPGAGKTLLAQATGHIVLGRDLPVSSYANDTDEMRKKLTAFALAGDRMILLDNLKGSFGNESLDRALTSTRWKDRILGKSQEVDLPLLPTWFATGNNVQVAADTLRRIIHIRLDCLDEHPEERAGFTHENLLGWVDANRGNLLSAALTILAAYLRAGSPTHGLRPFGSFEAWSASVREAVVWVGLPDPCLTRVRLAESADSTGDALGQLVSAWRAYDESDSGIVIARMLRDLYPSEQVSRPNDEAAIAMRAAIETFTGCPAGKTPSARSLGNRLKLARRRVVDGQYLDSDSNEHRRGGAVWRIHGVKSDGGAQLCKSSKSISVPSVQKFLRETEKAICDGRPEELPELQTCAQRVGWLEPGRANGLPQSVIELASEQDGRTPTAWREHLLSKAQVTEPNNPARAAELRQAADAMLQRGEPS